MSEKRIAMVDTRGIFHCPCGHKHNAGPRTRTTDVYQCPICAAAFRIRGVVELRRRK